MCFSSDQHPPLPPRTSDVGEHGPTVLTAADGTRLAAFDAVPVTRRGASLVLLPDIRGMHPYYTDLAIAFAQAGIDTVAIDPYARTAGLSDRGAGFVFRPHADALERSSLASDARAAKDRLASRSDDPVFTLGFCRFGAESWALSATDLGAAGCMGFYGKPGSVLELVPSMTAPLLILAAGADAATSPEENAAFDRALSDAGVDHEFVEYAGAPHSFFDRSFAQWEEACSDAWKRMLRFVDARR
ncbi:MAG TPA: dienelactone hydrolase family protein [Lapillicoccus sp.]|nr:dienelactone hydrolase family protein [Lapillicoccus sp.]